MGSVSVMRLSTVTETTTGHEATPKLTPVWRLKVIPRADGNGLDVMQLIDCTNTRRDTVVHNAARGRGAIAFETSPYLDLTPLQPSACSDAYFLETSYSEYYTEIVYDFLKESPPRLGQNPRSMSQTCSRHFSSGEPELTGCWAPVAKRKQPSPTPKQRSLACILPAC